MRVDYQAEHKITVKVRDALCEFMDMRVDRSTIPTGKFVYEVAGDDDSGGDPARIKSYVMVNFYGTLISDTELPIGEDGVLWLEDGDFIFMPEGKVN